MALAEFHLHAQNGLQKMKSFMALVPEGGKGPFPVFYLLHGLSDDHSAWTRLSSIERHMSGIPWIVIMPDGERGFYTDSKVDPRAGFESNIIKDLIPFVDSTFHTIPKREGRVVAGLSMGGYGAMKFALKYPHFFAAGASHSGALYHGHQKLSKKDPWLSQWIPVFGANPVGGGSDLFALSKKIPKAKRPKIRIDCGREDFLIQSNRAFHEHLDRIGFPHEYEEHAGGHDWAYWDLHIRETIEFFKTVLG